MQLLKTIILGAAFAPLTLASVANGGAPEAAGVTESITSTRTTTITIKLTPSSTPTPTPTPSSTTTTTTTTMTIVPTSSSTPVISSVPSITLTPTPTPSSSVIVTTSKPAVTDAPTTSQGGSGSGSEDAPAEDDTFTGAAAPGAKLSAAGVMGAGLAAVAFML
ncbi:hypothetical protein BJX61DRAFT_543092 [Aspergillus egyptiacus]|nr:hypothetical protein BJX61DRAFT_543092 [Aspergillus egyptiacus]